MFAMTRFLHVANGTSTTMTIEAAGIPGLRSIWADPLHAGPVPGGVSDDELVGVRTEYLGGVTTAAPDPINDLREWRAIIARDEAYDELVLWYEHDLFDQLNLIQLLAWIRGRLPAQKRVSLVCIDSFPGRPHFKGLGELSADELRPLLDTRQPVGEAHCALAARAWEAFRESSPEALDAFRRSDTAALPFLAPSLVRFLQEYPWTGDGLSRSERRLLQLAATETPMLAAAFPRMSEGDRWYHMTDLSLKALAETLSSAPPALLALSAATAETKWFRRSATITDAGRRVLAGEQDRVATCGIDRWMGGVHLEGHAVPWRWDEDAQSIVRS